MLYVTLNTLDTLDVICQSIYLPNILKLRSIDEL